MIISASDFIIFAAGWTVQLRLFLSQTGKGIAIIPECLDSSR
jgi:hypothetical protein